MVPNWAASIVANFNENIPQGRLTLVDEAWGYLFNLLNELDQRATTAHEQAKVDGPGEAANRWMISVSEIQQLICLTPLYVFLKFFAEHAPSEWIRSAAKGELCDHGQWPGNDPELGTITHCNMQLMMAELQDIDTGQEIRLGSPKLREINQRVIQSGLHIPGTKITTWDEEGEEQVARFPQIQDQNN